MKKILLLGWLSSLSLLTFAQSSTILPTQADFLSNSTIANAYAVKGTIVSSSPGGFSSGVRGQNNSTGGLGIGVYGSHGGSGWGVYGIAPSGVGVNGSSSSGVGVSGTSTSGYGVSGNSNTSNAGYFLNTNSTSTASTLLTTSNGIGSGITVQLTNASNGARGIDVLQSGLGPGVFATSRGGNAVWGITSSVSAAGVIGDNTFGEAVVGRNRGGGGVGAVVGRNDSTGYGVRGFNTKAGIGVLGQSGISGGTGIGGRFENVNAASSANALEATTNGTGNGAFINNTNNNGNGAGLVVQKTKSYTGEFTSSSNVDLEVRHPVFSILGMTGFRILCTGPNLYSWTFYTDDVSGGLYLYSKGNYRGNFNSSTGAYVSSSDARLKVSISDYSSTLKNLLKIGVKSYRLINSDKTEVGLIAQDVIKAFPEIVYTNTDNKGEQFYTMDYSRIGVLAVKAIQEQQLIIQKQQRSIQEQQITMQRQQKEIDFLKQEMSEIKRIIKK